MGLFIGSVALIGMFYTVIAFLLPHGFLKQRWKSALWFALSFLLLIIGSLIPPSEAEKQRAIVSISESLEDDNLAQAVKRIERDAFRLSTDADFQNVVNEVSERIEAKLLTDLLGAENNPLKRLDVIWGNWMLAVESDDIKKRLAPVFEENAEVLIGTIPEEQLENRVKLFRLLVSISSASGKTESDYQAKLDEVSTALRREVEGCPLPSYEMLYQVPLFLNDQSSFRPGSVAFGMKDEESQTQKVYLDYSAKNGFGGRVRATAEGVVDLRDCSFTLISAG